MTRWAIPAVFAATLLSMAPAAAQELSSLPFEKQMTLAEVGDVDAQLEVGLAFETGRGAIRDDIPCGARDGYPFLNQ